MLVGHIYLKIFTKNKYTGWGWEFFWPSKITKKVGQHAKVGQQTPASCCPVVPVGQRDNKPMGFVVPLSYVVPLCCSKILFDVVWCISLILGYVWVMIFRFWRCFQFWSFFFNFSQSVTTFEAGGIPLHKVGQQGSVCCPTRDNGTTGQPDNGTTEQKSGTTAS